MKTIYFFLLVLIFLPFQSIGQVEAIEKMSAGIIKLEKLIEKGRQEDLFEARDLMIRLQVQLKRYESEIATKEKPKIDFNSESYLCFTKEELEFERVNKKIKELEIEFLYLENRLLVNLIDSMNLMLSDSAMEANRRN